MQRKRNSDERNLKNFIQTQKRLHDISSNGLNTIEEDDRPFSEKRKNNRLGDSQRGESDASSRSVKSYKKQLT